jgi:hypothetical protein
MIDTGITERFYQCFAAFVYLTSVFMFCRWVSLIKFRYILATIVILGVTSVYIAIAVIPLAVMYFFVQKYYRKSSIELKRLEYA